MGEELAVDVSGCVGVHLVVGWMEDVLRLTFGWKKLACEGRGRCGWE